MKRSLTHEIKRNEQEVEDAINQKEAFVKKTSKIKKTSPEHEKYLQQTDQWIADKTHRIIPELKRKLSEVELYIQQNSFGHFITESMKLSQSGNSEWADEKNIFIRAFEAYVNDKMSEMGGRNEYLVHGVEQDRFLDNYKGNPYPVGQERQNIIKDIDVFLTLVHKRIQQNCLKKITIEDFKI